METLVIFGKLDHFRHINILKYFEMVQLDIKSE
jgi:hypothetical protein